MTKKTSHRATRRGGMYTNIILDIFEQHYSQGVRAFEFTRNELLASAKKFGFKPELEDDETIAKNLGDIIYSFRFRKDFPEGILKTAPQGKMWIILGRGDSRYQFRLISKPSIGIDPGLVVTKIHDATPEIVRRFALTDEQATLAIIRYNRLVDLFCRCVAYSLQNHLRTKVKDIGQIEIDELYVGANRQGEHFLIPVQVKRQKDRLGVSQLLQDIQYGETQHSGLKTRPIGAQMVQQDIAGETQQVIALFEFECRDTGDDILINKLAERHFLLLPHTKISRADFETAQNRHEEE